MLNPSINASICNHKSSSLVDTSSSEGLQRALAFGGWEGDLVLGLSAQLLAGLALVLVRLLRGSFGGDTVNIHVCQVTVSP
jgi:hypothetical protein